MHILILPLRWSQTTKKPSDMSQCQRSIYRTIFTTHIFYASWFLNLNKNSYIISLFTVQKKIYSLYRSSYVIIISSVLFFSSSYITMRIVYSKIIQVYCLTKSNSFKTVHVNSNLTLPNRFFVAVLRSFWIWIKNLH